MRGRGVCFFFFSSRRRHTRYWRDWSSDVCSSDLSNCAPNAARAMGAQFDVLVAAFIKLGSNLAPIGAIAESRSEERRVGKECRSGWSPYDKKKKNKVMDKNGEIGVQYVSRTHDVR